MPASAYQGSRRKLLLAFDVGTTYSGISYCLMDPGEPPKVQGVTRFPGQENIAGDAKIPSILFYDRLGNVRASGAEARLPAIIAQAEDEGWTFVEWFKLHLRPKSLNSQDLKKHRIPPLPRGKGVADIFADFLRYLLHCACRYISETLVSGRELWSSLENEIEFVLSHPNGWEGTQQQKMRRAAVAAGLIPDNTAGHSRVHFVTEGEASLQFCIRDNFGLSRSAEAGKSVIIIDAGGGTVDISSYTVVALNPLSVEEAAAPECLVQGSVLVNTRARSFLKTLLINSQYGNEDDLDAMCDNFDKATKPTFKDTSESAYIRFGSMRCNDPAVNIRRGQLTVSGSAMASFFEPSITAIVNAVNQQKKASAGQIDVAFLVGGFAASPWLYQRLQAALQQTGIDLCRPDAYTSKAVAEGAASYYLERSVAVRISKMTYGIEIGEDYLSTNPAHVQRSHQVIVRSSGRLCIPGVYSVILPKGKRMRSSDEVSMPYIRDAEASSTLDKIVERIECYRGPSQNPYWKDAEPANFTTICTVTADTSGVSKTPAYGTKGIYYQQEFKIIILCGLTELRAQVSWIENGVEKRGPAEIVYDGIN